MALSEDQEASFIGNYGVKSRVYMIMSTQSRKAIKLKKRKAVKEIAKKLKLIVNYIFYGHSQKIANSVTCSDCIALLHHSPV